MSRRLCLAGLPACTDVTNIIPEKVRLAKGVRTKNRKKEKLRIPQITAAAPGGEEDEHKADDPGRRFAEADGAVAPDRHEPDSKNHFADQLQGAGQQRLNGVLDALQHIP